MSELADVWKRQTNTNADALWDEIWGMDTKTLCSAICRNFKRETGIGLQWMLNEHRRLGLSVEPEFITLDDVPLSTASGIIEAGPPELFTQHTQRLPITDRQTIAIPDAPIRRD